MTIRDAGDLPAGGFSDWLSGVRAALHGEGDSDVPCGSCTACCRSSQFVHVGPDETGCLAHIPPELLFPAPGLPPGHVLMGYDEHGACPMLTGLGCSIYEHRPRTCRTYDCRIFPATGVEVETDKAPIREQARRWRFDHGTDGDRAEHAACRDAGAFVAEHADVFPDDAGARSGTRRAVLAVEIADAFLHRDASTGRHTAMQPTVDEVLVVLGRCRRADRPD